LCVTRDKGGDYGSGDVLASPDADLERRLFNRARLGRLVDAGRVPLPAKRSTSASYSSR
jgi:hypothetical protein